MKPQNKYKNKSSVLQSIIPYNTLETDNISEINKIFILSTYLLFYSSQVSLKALVLPSQNLNSLQVMSVVFWWYDGILLRYPADSLICIAIKHMHLEK